MAQGQHLALLDGGADAWNAWRLDEPEGLVPDLRDADLAGRLLDRVNLRGADLTRAVLKGCSLRHADLRDARLEEANLEKAKLRGADLGGASLNGARMAGAHLQEARMPGARGHNADLRGIQGYHLSMGSSSPEYPDPTDLTGSNLNRAWLPSAQLQGSILVGVQARDAEFNEADLAKVLLHDADLRRAKFDRAWLDGADLSGARLTSATLSSARARKTNLSGTDLARASLLDADLRGARLGRAGLAGANLKGADLTDAQCAGADLTDADLSLTSLVRTCLKEANIAGTRVYGASAWSLDLTDAVQSDLVITQDDEPTITVDDLEVAQLVYLMIDNKKIRNVLDTVTSKTVLILGRFTAERKAVLDAIRDDLRARDIVSIIFDFDQPAHRNLTETITLLARMARFVIVDLTDPSSVPMELSQIVQQVQVPVQPLIQVSQRPFSMFLDLLESDSVLRVHSYENAADLLVALSSKLLPALEQKRQAVFEKRARIRMSLKETR